MDFIQIALLVIAFSFGFTFLVANTIFLLTKPKLNVAGVSNLERQQAFQKWTVAPAKFEKIVFDKLHLHLIAGASLAIWIVIRVVLSFV